MDLIRVFLHNTHRLGIIDDEDVMGLRVILAQLRVILASEPKLYLNSHISNQLSFYAYVYCF